MLVPDFIHSSAQTLSLCKHNSQQKNVEKRILYFRKSRYLKYFLKFLLKEDVSEDKMTDKIIAFPEKQVIQISQ